MRLWSIHPSLLDQKGLVALWRESLLAQKVLSGQTKGYRQHPQLNRFKAFEFPLAAISTYLWDVQEEATERGYSFDSTKIVEQRSPVSLFVTQGQIDFEVEHLKKKLIHRDPKWKITEIKPHPIFCIIDGFMESWEKT